MLTSRLHHLTAFTMKFAISLMILSAATVSAIPAGSKECETIYQRCMETITVCYTDVTADSRLTNPALALRV